jgi:hypothetical protein
MGEKPVPLTSQMRSAGRSQVPRDLAADQNQGKSQCNNIERKPEKPRYSPVRTSIKTRRKASDYEETFTALKREQALKAIHGGGSL